MGKIRIWKCARADRPMTISTARRERNEKVRRRTDDGLNEAISPDQHNEYGGDGGPRHQTCEAAAFSASTLKQPSTSNDQVIIRGRDSKVKDVAGTSFMKFILKQA